MQAVKRNASCLASAFPRHSRFPTPYANMAGLDTNVLPSALRNRSGRNASGSGKWSGSLWTWHSAGIISVPLGNR